MDHNIVAAISKEYRLFVDSKNFRVQNIIYLLNKLEMHKSNKKTAVPDSIRIVHEARTGSTQGGVKK